MITSLSSQHHFYDGNIPCRRSKYTHRVKIIRGAFIPLPNFLPVQMIFEQVRPHVYANLIILACTTLM